MSAIDTLLALSQTVLTVLGVVIALIAIFGWVVIRNAVLERSKQIANKRMSDYMKGEEFRLLVSAEVDKAVELREQQRAALKLREDVKEPGDASPFEERP